MNLTSFLEMIAAVIGAAAIVVVGRSNIKKQIISDLQALVVSHQLTIEKLTRDNEEKDKRICALEETIDGYAELVRQGYLTGFSGPRSGNSAATP